jgi:hypothetical protein
VVPPNRNCLRAASTSDACPLLIWHGRHLRHRRQTTRSRNFRRHATSRVADGTRSQDVGSMLRHISLKHAGRARQGKVCAAGERRSRGGNYGRAAQVRRRSSGGIRYLTSDRRAERFVRRRLLIAGQSCGSLLRRLRRRAASVARRRGAARVRRRGRAAGVSWRRRAASVLRTQCHGISRQE